MSFISRSAGVSSFLGLLSVALIVLLFSLDSFGTNTTIAAPDEKPTTKTPPAKEKGNADKEEEPARALARFMRQKLQASSLILEGLCTEDLQMVSKGSDTLMKMSREERWRASNDVVYRRYSEQFVSAVEELKSEAEANDVNGSSMAWVDVTMKCLKCHEWVRNTVVVDAE